MECRVFQPLVGCRKWQFPETGGPQCRQQNTIILIIGTPKMVLGNLQRGHRHASSKFRSGQLARYNCFNFHPILCHLPGFLGFIIGFRVWNHLAYETWQVLTIGLLTLPLTRLIQITPLILHVETLSARYPCNISIKGTLTSPHEFWGVELSCSNPSYTLHLKPNL